jgi:hypothetical protein
MTLQRRLSVALLVLLACLFEGSWGADHAAGDAQPAGGGGWASDGAPPPLPPLRGNWACCHLPTHCCWTHCAALSSCRITYIDKRRLRRIPCRAAVVALLQLKAALAGWDSLVARHNVSLTGWRTPATSASPAAGTAAAGDSHQDAGLYDACQWTFVECNTHGRVAKL